MALIGFEDAHVELGGWCLVVVWLGVGWVGGVAVLDGWVVFGGCLSRG